MEQQFAAAFELIDRAWQEEDLDTDLHNEAGQWLDTNRALYTDIRNGMKVVEHQ